DARLEGAFATAVAPYPPTPQQSLFFYLADPIQMNKEGSHDFLLQPRCVVVGPQLNRVNLIVGKHHKSVRVGFHPGGLFRLLGVPMLELADEGFDASLFFGSHLTEVMEQLAEAPDHLAIKSTIETFLLSQIKGLKTFHPIDLALQNLVACGGLMSMEQTASDACLSLRQFERLCKTRLGMNPKLFARIARFSKAYRLSENKGRINWSSIAYECGYFDQMHMIRDFKDFAGVNPGMILSQLSATPLRLQKDIKF
ncbi:MAG: AraC family transcriptional regulator, partial [Flavisolibacter sp.]|nr:AraC family transcriptional regulator [Flavisolibacter sp.]